MEGRLGCFGLCLVAYISFFLTGAYAATVACSPDIQRAWTVENSEQAASLADSLNCSGGVFDVDWVGDVEIGNTIQVLDGTVLSITGIGGDAAVDGNGSIQCFRVVGATLRVSNLLINRCYSVDFGGAIFAEEATVALAWATLSNNKATYGGAAVYARSSDVSWGGDMMFNENEGLYGAAVRVQEGSNASWSANTTFSGNSGLDGGALLVSSDAEVFWDGSTTFTNNIADETGGAVSVSTDARVSWSGASTFLNNSAGLFGGAMYLLRGSDVVWSGRTDFVDNSAFQGGALYIWQESGASWSAGTNIIDNRATVSGGAIVVTDNSSVSWSGETIFAGNSVNSTIGSVAQGGALSVGSGSSATWSGRSTFSANSADNGGALFLSLSSFVTWTGWTRFSGNYASFNGGALGSSESQTGQDDAIAVINGTTWFVNNSCGANGGGAALIGGLQLRFEDAGVTFSGNSAAVGGGAVFISNTALGIVLTNITFVSNLAQLGGGVYSLGSGTEVENEGRISEVTYPTTFSGCSFENNRAFATGGAIDSAAGRDLIVNTNFTSNTARAGGALRLAGTASVTGCIFVENTSDEGEGPAVSNLGYMSDLAGSLFEGNDFNCEASTFRDYNETDRFAIVCDGCEPCGDCPVSDAESAPMCTLALENSASPGGSTALETLEIDPGYWRATTISEDVLACYNAEACRGGATNAYGYCKVGYEGPYCSVCTTDYSSTLAFTCVECTSTPGSVAVVVLIGILALLALVICGFHMVSLELIHGRLGMITRVIQVVPRQSLKIIIVAWQILTQFASVANVTYPDAYQRFLDGVNFLNFDLAWIPAFGCIVTYDFHDRLLMATIVPVMVMCFLGGTYSLALRRNGGSDRALQIVRHKHTSAALLVTFLVYSSVSATVFQTFACDVLDDGRDYLRADYRIECDSNKHRALMVYAGMMVAVYPVGIPLVYAVLLYKNRRVLKAGGSGGESTQVDAISDLWAPYTPKRYYYELVECARRIGLTGIAVFIYPNTAAQVAIVLVMAIAFFGISERLAPYPSKWDSRVSLAGHAIVILSMYEALLLKVDVSDERDRSQRVFAGILVAAHVCMVLAVVVETAILGFSVRAKEGPVMRFSNRKSAVSFVEEENVAREEEEHAWGSG